MEEWDTGGNEAQNLGGGLFFRNLGHLATLTALLSSFK